MANINDYHSLPTTPYRKLLDDIEKQIGDRLEMSMLVKVKDFTGRFAVDIESAKEVFDFIQLSIRFNLSSITIDFSGIDCFNSTFFCYAIGQLFKYFDSDTLRKMLNIKGLSQSNILLLQKVIDIAKDYYDRPIEETSIATTYRRCNLTHG